MSTSSACINECDWSSPIAESTVKDVVSKGFGQGVRGQRSSDGLWLKVCGKDEYLDP